jgi:ribosomal protein S27E
MKYEFDVDAVLAWKTYPVRVIGPRFSRCCSKPTLLVQSMTGGFVTANCSACGNKETLALGEFKQLGLWVSCPRCKKRMNTFDAWGNYAYSCDACDIYILLADILPRWEDLL